MEVAPITDDHVPALQLLQVAIELAPITDDHVPTAQLVQSLIELAPSTDDHVPTTQLLQNEPPRDQVPAGQVKHVDDATSR
jgi:hypothetical protein